MEDLCFLYVYISSPYYQTKLKFLYFFQKIKKRDSFFQNPALLFTSRKTPTVVGLFILPESFMLFS